jgi:hypothetical protein
MSCRTTTRVKGAVENVSGMGMVSSDLQTLISDATYPIYGKDDSINLWVSSDSERYLATYVDGQVGRANVIFASIDPRISVAMRLLPCRGSALGDHQTRHEQLGESWSGPYRAHRKTHSRQHPPLSADRQSANPVAASCRGKGACASLFLGCLRTCLLHAVNAK